MSNRSVEVSIRIAGECDEGYAISSVGEATRIIESMSETGDILRNLELLDPEEKKKLEITIDDNYTFLFLYKEICEQLGITYCVACDCNPVCPANGELLILCNNMYLYSVDDYNASFGKMINNFSDCLITVYFIPLFGRGEVYRGNGIKMHMRPEIGEKHHGAHVHVRGGDNRSASIDIDTLEMFVGRLSHKEKKEALTVIRDNRSVLLEIWNVLSEGVSINVDYSLGTIQFCEIS